MILFDIIAVACTVAISNCHQRVLLLQSYIQDFSTLLSENSGLNSTIYAALTAAFVITGFSYQFAPINTLNAVFGMAADKGLEDQYLWQLIGGSIATCIAPIAYTQRVGVFSAWLTQS